MHTLFPVLEDSIHLILISNVYAGNSNIFFVSLREFHQKVVISAIKK